MLNRLVVVCLIALALVGVATPARPVAAQNSCQSIAMYSAGNGLYVSAELAYGGDFNGSLRARGGAIGPWEKFTLCNWGSYWSIQSQANGKYVAVEFGFAGGWYTTLRARSSSIGSWEKFTVTRLGDGSYTIISQASGQYVTAELAYSGDWYGLLRARSNTVGPWQRFWFQSV